MGYVATHGSLVKHHTGLGDGCPQSSSNSILLISSSGLSPRVTVQSKTMITDRKAAVIEEMRSSVAFP